MEQSYRGPLGDQDGIITKSPIKKTAKPKADSGLCVCMYVSMLCVHVCMYICIYVQCTCMCILMI